jgi:manganese/zinc/iron transport system substrate-binding protein
MFSFRHVVVIALAVLGGGCTRSPSTVPSPEGDYATFYSQSTSAQAPGLTLPASGEGCSTNPPALVLAGRPFYGNYPVHVVCTTSMVADLARVVGGNHVAISQLLSAGVDPHQYKASSGDVSSLYSADLVFYSGLHLERKLSDVLSSLASQKPTFAVTRYIPSQNLLPATSSDYDPHVWLDVALWQHALDVVRDALMKYDPLHAEDYKQHADEYAVQLSALHDYVKSRLAEVPQEQRVLVSAHDAFRYFGRAYDVEVHGIQGISTESQAGVGEIENIVDLIVQRRIKAVFAETSVSDRSLQAVVDGCHARGHDLKLGPELYSDSLGQPGVDPSSSGGYIGMIRHDVDAITEALK